MPHPITRTAAESLAILVAGTAIGLLANAVSPRGIELGRDYFLTAPQLPSTDGPSAAAPAKSPGENVAANPTGSSAEKALVSKRGFTLAGHEEVAALFRDPRQAGQQIVFIDARGERPFSLGHIPGAYPFDHYRPERYLNDVLAVVTLAERIVVYCSGGDCEDSDLVASDLTALGVPHSKLVIYGGGFAEWRSRGMPVSVGDGKGAPR